MSHVESSGMHGSRYRIRPAAGQLEVSDMSFSVDTQLEAVRIGLSVVGRADIAALDSIEEMGASEYVKLEHTSVTNVLDDVGQYAKPCVLLTLKTGPRAGRHEEMISVGSAPFRSGFDIWLMDPKTGIGCRYNP